MQLGTRIKIISKKDKPEYNGKTGHVLSIDDNGNLSGTWGGFKVHPNVDLYEIEKCCICGKDISGFGNNASPLADGTCCDVCNQLVMAERLRRYLNNE